MEDLLASIRKAINEDIGPEQAAGEPAVKATAPRMGEEASATSSEIQQLREKITRSRTGAPLASRDPAQRAASLAAALRSNTPRRAWRDIEPVVQAQKPPPATQPAPRFRSTIVEPDTPRATTRVEQPARPAPRFTPERPAPVWPNEDQASNGFREGDPAAQPAPPQILSGTSAQAVQSAFNRLAENVLTRAIGEQSIEDMTRELLKAMLKQWLDDNLPSLVERLVREEIERVARTGR
jgi:uncharacterized protein